MAAVATSRRLAAFALTLAMRSAASSSGDFSAKGSVSVATAPAAAASPVVAPSLATSSLTDAGGPISKDEVDAAAGEEAH